MSLDSASESSAIISPSSGALAAAPGAARAPVGVSAGGMCQQEHQMLLSPSSLLLSSGEKKNWKKKLHLHLSRHFIP